MSVIKLYAGLDHNGNGRHMFVIFGPSGTIYDVMTTENVSDVREKHPSLANQLLIPEIKTTPTQYRELKKGGPYPYA